MPDPAPVTTATDPSSRPIGLPLRCDDVANLGFGLVGGQGVVAGGLGTDSCRADFHMRRRRLAPLCDDPRFRGGRTTVSTGHGRGRRCPGPWGERPR